MKRLIILFLVFVLCVSLAGCGKVTCSIEGCEDEAVEDDSFEEAYCNKHLADKKAFDISKVAYDNIKEAYDLTAQLAFDLHNAWYIGVYENEQANGKIAKHIASKLEYLSEEELKWGIARAIAWEEEGKKWNSLSEEEKKGYFDFAGSEFYVQKNFQGFCISGIMNAFYLNGQIEKIESLLENAKTQMKKLSEMYFDYVYYPNLKAFYSNTTSYFDACYSGGDGGGGMSFNQFKEVQIGYEKEARDYIADLDFIFTE